MNTKTVFIISAMLFVMPIVGCGSSASSSSPLSTAPSNVTATPGNGQVTLSWTPVLGATSYNISWDLSSQESIIPNEGPPISTMTSPYTQVGLTNGVTYNYTITAVNNDYTSPASIQVSATPEASLQ